MTRAEEKSGIDWVTGEIYHGCCAVRESVAGALEGRESLQEAAIRKLAEPSGIDAEIGKQAARYASDYEAPDGASEAPDRVADVGSATPGLSALRRTGVLQHRVQHKPVNAIRVDEKK